MEERVEIGLKVNSKIADNFHRQNLISLRQWFSALSVYCNLQRTSRNVDAQASYLEIYLLFLPIDLPIVLGWDLNTGVFQSSQVILKCSQG